MLPPIGIIDIDSVPPATMASAPPTMMRSAAIAIACSPDEQKRLMVSADTSTGSPARNDAMRATFMPCSPSGIAQPRMTSSISFGSNWGTRSSAPLIATAANSSGRVARSVPLNARPTGVRTADTITTSLIIQSPVLGSQFPAWRREPSAQKINRFRLSSCRLAFSLKLVLLSRA